MRTCLLFVGILKFGRTVYRLTHEVVISDYPNTKNEDAGLSTTDNKETKNNNTTNNIDLVVDAYNAICLSFPKLTKLSDKRKKTIKARFNQGYTAEDFKRVFELAEGSSFLKGENARNWMVSFDWLIADSNMAKVLDNIYADRQKKKGGVEGGTRSQSRFKL